MSPQPRSVRFTYEDFLLFPNDGKRHEIIDGDHFMTPSPDTKHQRVSGNLFNAIANFLKGRKNGEVFTAPFDVMLSDEDIVEPDLLFVSADRSAIITDKNVQGPPDLVVEILSDSTRKTDEIVKRKLYERYGVREYWIVDPEVGDRQNLSADRPCLRPGSRAGPGSQRDPLHPAPARFADAPRRGLRVTGLGAMGHRNQAIGDGQ